MDVIIQISIFLSWSVGAIVCSWLTYHGAKMVKSSQEGDFSLYAKKDELKINGKFKAGLFLATLGIGCLVYLIASYWKVVYALAVLAFGYSVKDNISGNSDGTIE